jgi:hypothetical protein
VIQLGTYVPSDEYKSLVLEPVIKLFANPDRGTRMAILDVLPEFADKLDKQTVSEKIWPHLVSIVNSYTSDPNLIDDGAANRVYGHSPCCPRDDCEIHRPSLR